MCKRQILYITRVEATSRNVVIEVHCGTAYKTICSYKSKYIGVLKITVWCFTQTV